MVYILVYQEVICFKLTKHDQYTQELLSKIQDSYDSLSTNVQVTKKKRCLTEIDVVARRGNYFDLYEVKCSYRITKAKQQAKSFRKHFKDKINNIYFYCGATSSMVLLYSALT